MYPRRSEFRDGRYRGYEILLRIDRNGKRYNPYPVHNADDIYRLMAPLSQESAGHLYSLNLDGKNQVTSVYLVGKGGLKCLSAIPFSISCRSVPFFL